VAPKKAIAAALYTTATKKFDLQHPHLPGCCERCMYRERTQKSDMPRERHGGSRCSCQILSMSSEVTEGLNFTCGWQSDRSRGLPRVLVRWYAGGADTCRVSAGQKKSYNLIVPKEAMAAASYAVATTKVESQCPHLSGGVGGDMSAKEKHIDSVLRKRDEGDFKFLTKFCCRCVQRRRAAPSPPASDLTSGGASLGS
jgi:hypothetical protein